MTFQNLDELVDFFEQIAADKMRKFETDVILHADDFNDAVGDVVDAAREWQAEAMAAWRVQMRREFAALPFKFPSGSALRTRGGCHERRVRA